ncbi:MAG: hypothetical protein WBC70_14625 [Candidatus Aminicenantales bacterium]
MNKKTESTGLKKHVEEWDQAKMAARCPRVREARESLFLTVPQFCEIVGISKADYWDIEGGQKQLSVSQKCFLVEAIRLAKEAGLIRSERDY